MKKKDEPFYGYCGSGKTPKRCKLSTANPERVWILEYFQTELDVWCYIDKGKGVPFGPWKMERAVTEMELWAKTTARPDHSGQEGPRLEWRIRNLETNEVIPLALFGA